MNIIVAKIKQASHISTAEDYSFFRDPKDKVFRESLEDAKFYIIGQRPSVFFSKIEIELNYISGTIKQDITNIEVDFMLPINQFDFIDQSFDSYKVKMFENIGVDEQTQIVFFGGKNSTLVAVDTIYISTKEDEFVLNITPDAILWKFVEKGWKFDSFKGQFQKLFGMDVLYIGEAAIRKDGVLGRLYVHETFLKILLQRESFNRRVQIKKELIILPFKIDVSIGVDWRISHSLNESINKNQDSFPLETLFKDMEKAFIRIFDPPYNNKKYKNYPKSDDGLSSYDYNQVVYMINNFVILRSIDDDKVLMCGLETNMGNYIKVDFDENKLLIASNQIEQYENYFNDAQNRVG